MILGKTKPVGALLLCAALITGCGGQGLFSGDFRPEASGPEGHITVVIDSTLWQGPVGDALRDQVGGPLHTLPSQEPAFELEPIALTSRKTLDMVQDRKNVLFVGTIADTLSAESRYLNSLLTDSLRQYILDGQSALVSRPDQWRRHQLVYYLVAASPKDLLTALDDTAEDMLYHYNEVTRMRTHREMFDIGRQHDLEATLMDRHGFAVNGQHDYVIAVDTTQFVWLRRVLSDTWRSLFVYYVDDADPSILTPEWIVSTRNELSRQYMQGTAGGWVEIDLRRPAEAVEINFMDRFAIEFRGMWQMVGERSGEKIQFGMGGPFLTYAFYDEPTRRLYLIDGMVFAPNYPKREFLRQLEVIAYTFRTRQEEAERATA